MARGEHSDDNSEESKLKLKSGENYKIKNTTGGFEPLSLDSCNLNLDSVNEGCLSARGSRFTIDKLDEDKNEAHVMFLSVRRLNKKDFDCYRFWWFKKDSVHCEKGIQIMEDNEKKYVTENLLYKHELKTLELYSEKEESPINIDLKLVLIPQKIYFHNYEHSANPTFGVAISGRQTRKHDGINFIMSADYGIGFNQISIETPDGVEDRMGLSIFAGYGFIGEGGIRAGIYYGVDYVKLNAEDLFLGDSKRKRAWLGLVVSAILN